MKRMLFLSRWFPFPADNGARLRVYNLLREFSKTYAIDLISFTSEAVGEERLRPMREFCHRVDVALYRPFQPGRWQARLALFSPLPRSVLDTENAEMRALIARCAESSPYDAVLASEVDMAQYIRPLPGLKVLEEVELAALYEQTRRETHPIRRARKLLMWQKWAAYLRAVAGNVAGATVVSEPERALLQRTLGQRKIPLRVIPNGVDLARYQGDFGAPVENTLIFPGALTYSANFDAMIFFLGQVFPLIRAEIPEVRLSITGGHSGIPVERLPSQPGVTLTGYLGDIRPALAQSWACVTPLGIGGGTRLKILEALALGTPVISTSKGAEGLEISPGREVLIADEPHEFAAQVVRVLRDASLRQRLADNGRAAVRAYHWAEIVASYEQFLDELRATV